MDELILAGNFPAVSFEEWQKSALKALQGAPITALETTLYEGIKTRPLYRRGDDENAVCKAGMLGAAPYIRGAGQLANGCQPWTIIQFLDHLDVTEANHQLREDLANGCKAVWLQLGGNIPYGGAYLGARTLARLEDVFRDIVLYDINVYISGGFDAVAGTALMVALWEKQAIAPERVTGSAGFDPLSIIAASGFIPAEREHTLSDVLDAATYLRDKGYALRPFMASGRAWHQAGGSNREELAYTLSAAVTYWRAMVDAGWTLEQAADAIQFVLTADADLFLTIAKFRAMRALWARATEASGIEPKSAAIIAEMSFRGITERDPHVNLLRATAATFGAGLGGADGILVIPFNTRHGTPDHFSRHLARNTQLILQEEAHLGRVADAAGGSWYVEHLTQQLAEEAWNEFRRVEAAGGLVAALENGMIARSLTDVSMRRADNLGRNHDKITGVSAFPNLAEQPIFSRPEDLNIDLAALDTEGTVPTLPTAGTGERFAAMVMAANDGASLKGLERASDVLLERYDFIPATSVRTAEPFEALRAASDRALARVRARPPIFLANLGPLSEYNAKASWAQNFFAAGGIEVCDQGGFTDNDTLIRAFQRSPAPVACICTTAKRLIEMSGVAAKLREAGAVAVYIVADTQMLKAIPEEEKRSLDRIIYEGCNMLKILTELHHMMRVKELGEVEAEDFEEDDDLDPEEF